MSTPSVGIIILAAGASTRMGTPKQLLTYRGQSFLSRIAEAAVGSICQPVVVVLGAYAERLRHEVSDLPVQVMESQWTEGMSASIRAGMEALATAELEAVVLALCDQPFVSSQIIDRVVRAYHLTGKPIVASEYGGTWGVPALFDRTFFAELTAMKGAAGAKQIIEKYSHKVFAVSFPEGAIDIDTPSDYDQLKKRE